MQIHIFSYEQSTVFATYFKTLSTPSKRNIAELINTATKRSRNVGCHLASVCMLDAGIKPVCACVRACVRACMRVCVSIGPGWDQTVCVC